MINASMLAAALVAAAPPEGATGLQGTLGIVPDPLRLKLADAVLVADYGLWGRWHQARWRRP